jgi:hypothetical protein
VSPLLYSVGQITFPQIHAAYERPGHGDLTWLKKFSPVKVQRVDADGTVIATDYRGFISDFNHQGRALTCSLGGEAEGRAAMANHPMSVFPVLKDVGTLVAQSVRHSLRLPVANQPTTGVLLPDTGGPSQLDFLSDVLAKSTQLDGTQWTVMPNSSGAYRMFQKDTTTIAASVYIDGFRVVENLTRDFTEEPNRIWVNGVDPDGKRIRFAIMPGLPLGPHVDYPGTPLSPGDSGDNVTALMQRLFHVGYLDDSPLGESWTTDPDDPVTAAIEDLQDDADLTVNGIVDAATWKALYNPDITGYSLRGSAIKPASQDRKTKAFLRNLTGQVIGNNPKYDRTVPFVDATIDARGTRRQLKKWANHERADGDLENWVGTVTVYTGAVIDGEHNPGDPLTSSLVRDARSILPGHNLWLPNWGGGTLVHVSGVQVSPDSVEYTVDTRARDTMKVWEVIKRNRESRKSPSRQWIAQNRRSGQRDDTGAFYDGSMFGRIGRTFCPAGTWTVIASPAGRSGTLQTIDLQTDTDPAAFVMAIFGKQVDADWCNRKLGDPVFGTLTDTTFADRVEANTTTWQDNRWLVDIFGQNLQPCGYSPRSHTKPDGTTTDAPITGAYRYKAGLPYYCKNDPVLWIAIRPDRDCYVQGGRVLELLLDDSAS